MKVGRTLLSILICLLLASVSSATTVLASPGYEIHPSLDQSDFIIYTVKQGNITSDQVFPPSFRIEWYGEYDKVVKGWWCPAWWDPNCDPAKYRYTVESKHYTFRVMPPQIIEYDGARILLSYFVSLSVIPYASRSWWGWFEEHVKITVSVYAYATIDKPPEEPGTIDLGQLIASNISSDRIYLDYTVKVKRIAPSEEMLPEVTGSFDLLLDGLDLFFYKLYAESIIPNVETAKGVGSFETDGYIGIVPKGSISVTLCLDGPSGYSLKGKVSYTTRYGTFEAPISLDSGSCSSTTIKNAILIPGNYTGNNKFTITFKSGALTVNLESDAEVSGSMGIVSMPFMIITPGDTWKATLYMGVDYAAYGWYETFYVSARGTVYIGDIAKSFTCDPVPFSSSGTFKCQIDLGHIGIDPLDVNNATADIIVEVSMYGKTYSDEVTIGCSLISPSNTHGLVATLYNMLSRGALLLILGLVLVYMVNYLFAYLGRPLVDPYYISQSLMIAVVLASVVFAIPYFYWFLLKIVYAIPEFSQILSRTPLNNPDQLLGMPPDQAIAMLVNYYDMTLNALKTDYKLWFESQMFIHVFGRLLVVGIVVAFLVAVGLALLISMNSGIVGAILGPVLGYASMVISMMLMITPLAGVVNTLIAIAEFVIVMSAVLFLVLFIMGMIAAIIPVPLSQRFAEDFLGGGIMYLLAIPSFAPIIYSLYVYIRSNLDYYIKQLDESLPHLDIGFLNLNLHINAIVPITPVMRMIGYVMMASITLLMIILLHAYILSRTGVMTGLGESLMRVARR